YYKVNPDMVNSVLNVREMYPNGTVIDTLMPGEEILVLEMVDNNTWAKIQFNDQEAYVSAGYIIYSRAYEEEEIPEEPVDPKPEFVELPNQVVIGFLSEAYGGISVGDIVWI